MKLDFIQKRLVIGEDWSTYKTLETVSNKKEKTGHFIETSRPELSSHLFSGTVLKCRKPKRKHSEMETFTKSQIEWSDNLFKNLSSCDYAVRFQKFILDTMIKHSLLTPQKQCFLKIKQETAKLASLNKCSNGTFVCTVFKCNYMGKNLLYIRYIESGVYNGLMIQKYVHLLKEKYNLSDDYIFLHHVITSEDIEDMTKDNNKGEVKRCRPDKTVFYSVNKVFPKEIQNLRDFQECEELMLDAFIVHILPFKSKVTLDNPEKTFLEIKNSPVSSTCLNTTLIDFRMHKMEVERASSLDILKEPTIAAKNLLQQSLTLNFLSGDNKRKPHLFKRPARFQSNFLEDHYEATSLRNRTIQLYLETDFCELTRFYMKYFPELGESSEQFVETSDHERSKKIKRSSTRTVGTVKRLVVTQKD